MSPKPRKKLDLHRTLFLLPNMITLSSVFCGFDSLRISARARQNAEVASRKEMDSKAANAPIDQLPGVAKAAGGVRALADPHPRPGDDEAFHSARVHAVGANRFA